MLTKAKPSLWLTSLLAVAAPWATYLQLAPYLTVVTMLVMVQVLAIALLFGAGAKRGAPRFVWLLLLYFCVVMASVIWTLNVEAWANYAFWWIVCLITAFASARFLTDARRIRAVVIASAIGAVISALLLEVNPDPKLFEQGRFIVHGHNANFTAYVLAGGFYLSALYVSSYRTTRVMRLILLASCVLIAVVISLLGTRGALLSVGLVSAFFVFSRLTTHRLRLVFVYLSLIIAVGFSFGAMAPILILVDSLSGRSTGDLSGRLVLWTEAIGYLLTSPILGIGPGSFAQISTLQIGVHNLFLTILLDTGAIGGIVFVALAFSFAKALMAKDNVAGSKVLLFFLCYWLPIVTSGHWELSPFSWLVVGTTYSVAQALGRDRVDLSRFGAAPLIT